MKHLKTIGSFSSILIAAAFVLFASQPVFAGGDEPEKDAGSALTADFAMSRTISALKSELKSEGRLTLGGEGRLRWETLAPAKSLLIINRGKGWIHYPDLKMTKGFDLSTDPVMRVMSEQLSALTTGRFEAVQHLYDISAPKDGSRTLIPKSPEIKKLFREMRVKVNADGAVTEVLLVSANGDTTRISFQHIVLNPKLSEDLFKEPK